MHDESEFTGVQDRLWGASSAYAYMEANVGVFSSVTGRDGERAFKVKLRRPLSMSTTETRADGS